MPQTPAPAETGTLYQSLESICSAGLALALDPATQVLARQLRDRTWQPTWRTEDLTSTAIGLIGIHRAGLDPATISMVPEKSLAAICRLTRQHRYPGAVGLVLWAHALWDGLPTSLVIERTGVEIDSGEAFYDRLTTMELAWLVSGLLHQWVRSHDVADQQFADRAMERLIARFSPSGRLMHHASPAASWKHRLRRYMANFADQIYSVQALSFAAIAREHTLALDVARQVAQRLIALQGRLGQWWWHYDSRHGGIVQNYPVYSVHQHGMAPMALAALQRAGDQDLRPAIELSQRWLTDNESGRSMIDPAAGTIWRDVRRNQGTLAHAWRLGRALAGRSSPAAGATGQQLKVNFETRPYEWAWCLYAGAIESDRRVSGHIV